MPDWQLVSISFGVSQIALALGLLAGLRPLTQQQVFYAAFLLSVLGFLMHPVVTAPAARYGLGVLTGFVPGTFFLFSVSLFDDNFALRPWHFVAVALTVVPPAIANGFFFTGISLSELWFIQLPQVLEFVLLAIALGVAVRYWSPDLVAERRALRLWFSGFTGVYLFLLILLRELIMPGSPALDLLQYPTAALTLLGTNLLLLRYRRSLWPSPATSHPSREEPDTSLATTQIADPGTDTVPAPDADILSVLRQLMDEECIYREMGLTLPELARRAEVPAYRLRATINTGLGYRNFNDFLNSYRIREAAERLADTAQQETQVLVIALESGFRSLSSFNKAFRRAMDTTPTEYRQQKLNP